MNRWEWRELRWAFLFFALGGSDLYHWSRSGGTIDLVLGVLFIGGSLVWLWRARPGRKAA